MSREGCLKRIEQYKRIGKGELVAQEEAFFNKMVEVGAKVTDPLTQISTIHKWESLADEKAGLAEDKKEAEDKKVTEEKTKKSK